MLRPLLVGLCLGLAQPGQVLATALQPFAVLPGGGLAYKPVISLRQRRFVHLVEQRTDFSCGAAAMASLLNGAYGMRLDEATVIRGMLAEADPDLVRRQGFSMLDMKRYAGSLGLRARGYRLEASSLASIQVPTLVLLETRGYRHFVLLLRSTEEWVYIGDPALGHKKMPMTAFEQGWNGIVFAVIGQGYNRSNALLMPPEPLTARQRLNRFNPVKDAELMEFGFIQSDFF